MFDWSSTKGLVSMAGSALLIMLAIGIGIGYVMFQPSASEASSRLETSVERISRLESSIASKDGRFNDLLNVVGEYKQEIARVKATNGGLLEQIAQQRVTVSAAEFTKKTAATDMQSTFYKLIEEQSKSLMLAEVQEEFIFRVIDPAVVPELKSGPKRAFICVLGTLLGGMLGIAIVLIQFAFRREKRSRSL